MQHETRITKPMLSYDFLGFPAISDDVSDDVSIRVGDTVGWLAGWLVAGWLAGPPAIVEHPPS